MLDLATGADFFNKAKSYVGKITYSHSNSGTKYDCSGFVRMVLKQFKVDPGSNCEKQLAYWRKKHKSKVTERGGGTVKGSSLKAGDLIYKMNYSGSSDHVMIADGKGGVVESSSGAGGVRYKKNYSWAYKGVTATVSVFGAGGKADTSGGSSGGGSSSSAMSEEEAAAAEAFGSEGSATGGTSVTYNPDYSYLLSGGLPLTNVDSYKGVVETYLSMIKGGSSVTVEEVKLSSTNIGYIIDLSNNKTMKFILPEFSDNVGANYDNIIIPGRSADIPSYSNTQSRNIPIELHLYAGTGLYTGNNAVEDMLKDISFLQSLCYPDYSSGIVVPPPMVMAYLGPSTIIKGIVTDVNVNYMKPYTTSGKPMRADVTVTIKQATDYPADLHDVRSKNTASY